MIDNIEALAAQDYPTDKSMSAPATIVTDSMILKANGTEPVTPEVQAYLKRINERKRGAK